MQNSETGNATNGAKTADRRSLGFPGGVGGEGNPALYSNGADTPRQMLANVSNPSQNTHNRKLAFSRLPKNHRHKSTEYLNEADLIDITLAAKTAHDIGRPFNLNVAVHIDPDSTLERPQDLLAGYLYRLRRWLAKHGCPLTYFWILEKPIGIGLHAHLMLHIPPKLQNNTKDGFRSWQQRAWYRTGVKLNAEPGTINTERVGPRGYDSQTADDRTEATYFRQLRGLLKYHCKAINPQEQSRLAADTRSADLFGIVPEYQGAIHGRRYSRSMDISERSRTLLWLNGTMTDFKAHTAPLMTK